jgi:CRP-like cAMP-binding protein
VPRAKTPPFNVEKFLNSTNGGSQVSNYGTNQKVFSQGDPADAVFYIQEGRVKLSIVSERGKEAVVALHGKGDFFGEGCLTGQPLRLATAATMTDCVITRLEKATIVRVLHDEPEFSEKFVAHLLARNARVEEDLVDQLFNSSEKRFPQARLHRVQWGSGGPQLSAERGLVRQSRTQEGRVIGRHPADSSMLHFYRESFSTCRLRPGGAPDLPGHRRRSAWRAQVEQRCSRRKLGLGRSR